jgi:membrane-bound lytic murein transglycosylase MltF
VRLGNSYARHLEELNADFAARGLAPVEFVDAPAQLEDEDVLEMVNARLVEYAVVDNYIARQWKRVLADIRVHDDVVVRGGNEIAFAIRKNSPLLKNDLDTFLAGTWCGTAFGNIVYRRYLESTRFVTNATARSELEKLQQLATLFRRYGDRYGIDWLLMAAQGYQESGLDHSVRSPVGAIGVMQVTPATGGDMKVGDIVELDNNIHAGVKYMRYVIDTFFDDPAVDPLNRMLFAFASSNSGPGRVRGLRNTASERGLDPNAWFNNVEHIAAEKIGRETLQYVANIYKYYTAYRLVQAEARLKQEAKPDAGT